MNHTFYFRLVCRTTSSLAGLFACFALSPSSHAQTEPTENRVVVTARPVESPTPNPDDTRPKLEHIMKEVSGTQITVTKKATVIKLDKQPPVENNNAL